MRSDLTEADLQTVLDQAQRFARDVLAADTARPEEKLPRATLDVLLDKAAQAGFIPEAGDVPSGLWVDVDDALGPTLSVRTVSTLAAANPGVAWACHQRAMPFWLARRLNAPELLDDHAAVILLQGYHGLGRSSLPRYLLGTELGSDDRALLSDWLLPTQRGARRVVHAPGGFRVVLTPRFDGDAIRWVRQAADVLDPVERSPTLGLDEVDAVGLCSSDVGELLGPQDPAEARKVFAEALVIQALALVAVGLGCLRHARDLARDQAGTRVQGGCRIEEHAAVRSLLGSAETAVSVVDALLRRMAEGPLRGDRIGEVFAARAEAHPILCRGATDALQVFGGSGYMQDVGMEKALRDSQQLRLMGGTPSELKSFVAEWERAR